MADGTRLAYELILPAQHSAAAAGRFPVLFKYTPYLRTWTVFDANGRNLVADFIELTWLERAYMRLRYWFVRDGRYFGPLLRTTWLQSLVENGYAVIIVERPGTGASFGIIDPGFESSAREASEVCDWIAAQPWSNGRIGMFGDSFQAMVQFAAAGSGNAHLKAIFPAASPIEVYDSIEYPGGVYNKAFATFFAGAADRLETLVRTWTTVPKPIAGSITGSRAWTTASWPSRRCTTTASAHPRRRAGRRRRSGLQRLSLGCRSTSGRAGQRRWLAGCAGCGRRSVRPVHRRLHHHQRQTIPVERGQTSRTTMATCVPTTRKP
jgi:predicted acyl esterase